MVDGTYIEQLSPVMERRLGFAGQRLAEVINQVLR
jgi:hypothetical protein